MLVELLCAYCWVRWGIWYMAACCMAALLSCFHQHDERKPPGGTWPRGTRTSVYRATSPKYTTRVKWCMKREVENRLLRRLRGPFTKVKAVTLWAPHGHVSWPSFAGWSAGNAWRAARSWAIDMLGRVSSSNWNFFSFI